MCARALFGSGHRAPACAPCRPGRLSMEKHMCFETVLFGTLLLFQTAVLFCWQARDLLKRAVAGCAQARWFVRVGTLRREF